MRLSTRCTAATRTQHLETKSLALPTLQRAPGIRFQAHSVIVAGMLNRTPPKSVRKILRAEVGFCCPVSGCSSPYLTYHHFDPPWRVSEHHNPEGIIALCQPHHSQADGGVFTVDQLRRLKAAAKNFTSVGGQSNWQRENTLIVIGGSYIVDMPQIICIRDNPILWLTKSPEGNDLLNIDLRGPTGEILFLMLDNEWLAVPPVDDVIAPPQTRSLSIRSKSTSVSLDIHFTAEQPELIRKRIIELGTNGSNQSVEDSLKGFPPEVVEGIRETSRRQMKEYREKRLSTGGYFATGETLVCEIACEIVWPEPVSIKPDKITIGSTILTGNVMINNFGAAINIRCTELPLREVLPRAIVNKESSTTGRPDAAETASTSMNPVDQRAIPILHKLLGNGTEEAAAKALALYYEMEADGRGSRFSGQGWHIACRKALAQAKSEVDAERS